MGIWEDIASAVAINYSFISGLIRTRASALRLDMWDNLIVFGQETQLDSNLQ